MPRPDLTYQVVAPLQDDGAEKFLRGVELGQQQRMALSEQNAAMSRLREGLAASAAELRARQKFEVEGQQAQGFMDATGQGYDVPMAALPAGARARVDPLSAVVPEMARRGKQDRAVALQKVMSPGRVVDPLSEAELTERGFGPVVGQMPRRDTYLDSARDAAARDVGLPPVAVPRAAPYELPRVSAAPKPFVDPREVEGLKHENRMKEIAARNGPLWARINKMGELQGKDLLELVDKSVNQKVADFYKGLGITVDAGKLAFGEGMGLPALDDARQAEARRLGLPIDASGAIDRGQLFADAVENYVTAHGAVQDKLDELNASRQDQGKNPLGRTLPGGGGGGGGGGSVSVGGYGVKPEDATRMLQAGADALPKKAAAPYKPSTDEITIEERRIATEVPNAAGTTWDWDVYLKRADREERRRNREQARLNLIQRKQQAQ